jgi:hypothetical protein
MLRAVGCTPKGKETLHCRSAVGLSVNSHPKLGAGIGMVVKVFDSRSIGRARHFRWASCPDAWSSSRKVSRADVSGTKRWNSLTMAFWSAALPLSNEHAFQRSQSAPGGEFAGGELQIERCFWGRRCQTNLALNPWSNRQTQRFANNPPSIPINSPALPKPPSGAAPLGVSLSIKPGSICANEPAASPSFMPS